MRTLPTLIALPLLFASCSGSDPEALTREGCDAYGKGENKVAVEKFDAALAQFGADTNAPMYLRAALGRCQALARVDARRARLDFVDLASRLPGKIRDSDCSLIVDALQLNNTTEARLEAIELLEAGKKLFPESAELKKISEVVVASAKRAKDPKALEKLKSLGYVGD